MSKERDERPRTEAPVEGDKGTRKAEDPTDRIQNDAQFTGVEGRERADLSAKASRDMQEQGKLGSLSIQQDGGGYNNQPVTDLRGRALKHQPGPNEIPVLLPGHDNNGGEYKKFEPARPAEQRTPPLNANEIFEKAKESTVHIRTPMTDGRIRKDAPGSGVVIGKSEDKTYIATVNHNVAGIDLDGMKIRPTGSPTVEMPNGKKYAARILEGDKKSDRALLEVDTGTDTATASKTAQVSEAPQLGPSMSAGYPSDSKSLYASPGDAIDTNVNLPAKKGYPDHMIRYKQRAVDGNSGGPQFNSKGEVQSLLEGADKNGLYEILGTPLTKAMVEAWQRKYSFN
ncbi:MAG TPA: serine protease [Candidatus Melainabacteria bacterium]|nr:serine protease [Candidatus Melainabacteria bacterium]